MKKHSLIMLLLAATLFLTACGYKKPERYNVRSLGADSITTVCGTDCSLSDVKVVTAGINCSVSYSYTKVAGNNGVGDAKIYYEYLSAEDSCVKIDEFSEAAGTYTAYLGDKNAINSTDTQTDNGEKKVALGVSIKVNFTPDSYTVIITDNINLDEILAK